MVDYLQSKIETFEGINNNLVAPTSEQAGNGSHLIAQFNSLIDDVQLESNATLRKDVIASGLLVVPKTNGLRVTAGQYIDAQGVIYDIPQQDITTGIVADTSRQFVILNYQTGVGKIEQNGYTLGQNEIKLATFSTELKADTVVFNSGVSTSIGNLNNNGINFNLTQENKFNPSSVDELLLNETPDFVYSNIIISAFHGQSAKYYKIFPYSNNNNINILNFTDWTPLSQQDTFPFPQQFTKYNTPTVQLTPIQEGGISTWVVFYIGYTLTKPNTKVIDISLRYSAELKDQYGSHKRNSDYTSLIPKNILFLNGNYNPLFGGRNGMELTPNSLYLVDSENDYFSSYSNLTKNSFEFFSQNTTTNAYIDFYVSCNNYVNIYIEDYDGTNTKYALDYYDGEFILSGFDYNEKVKLSINNNGEIYINEIKVLETQKTVISDLNVTATSGSLPVDAQSLTIANASTPTVQELLKYCTYLKQQVTDLKTQLKSHGLIV